MTVQNLAKILATIAASNPSAHVLIELPDVVHAHELLDVDAPEVETLTGDDEHDSESVVIVRPRRKR